MHLVFYYIVPGVESWALARLRCVIQRHMQTKPIKAINKKLICQWKCRVWKSGIGKCKEPVSFWDLIFCKTKCRWHVNDRICVPTSFPYPSLSSVFEGDCKCVIVNYQIFDIFCNVCCGSRTFEMNTIELDPVIRLSSQNPRKKCL